MSDIFISYSRADRDRVQVVVEALRSRACTVWWDPELHPGDVWDEVIEAALEEAATVIVLWSSTSRQSRWVKNEARWARQKNILVPVLIEDVTGDYGGPGWT